MSQVWKASQWTLKHGADTYTVHDNCTAIRAYIVAGQVVTEWLGGPSSQSVHYFASVAAAQAACAARIAEIEAGVAEPVVCARGDELHQLEACRLFEVSL